MPKDGEVRDQDNENLDDEANDKEQRVPLSRLNQVLRKLEAANARISALETGSGKPKQEEKVYTRAELAAAVEAGQITQLQADEYMDKQTLAKAKAEMSKEVEAKSRDGVAQRELEKYQEKIPALLDEDSEEFQAVAKEYRELLALGSPPTMATMLAATKAACGPLVLAGGVKTKRRSGFPEGGSGASRNDDDDGDKMPKKQREYYDKQIAQGRMTKEQAEKQWEAYQKRRGVE